MANVSGIIEKTKMREIVEIVLIRNGKPINIDITKDMSPISRILNKGF